MKAVRIHRYGDASVLQIDDVPRPELRPDDVRIRVCASSVNPVDWKIRSGGQRNIIPLKFPWILGLDVSGVVTEIGRSVKHFRVGDEVWSSPTHRRPGTYAEEVCIDESEVAKKPISISHDEAASLPLVALTAYQALAEVGHLGKGQTALIHAGAGGVGSVAIQFAKYLGARVITTCSERNAEFVKSLGADEVVDYTKVRPEEVVSGVDFILDSIGESTFESNLKMVRRGGRIANITINVPAHVSKHGPVLGTLTLAGSFIGMHVKPFLKKNVCLEHVIKRCDGIMLEQIADLVDAGIIRPVIDKVFPLDLIREAHRYSESNRARGKIVLHVTDPSG
jgi:alcohol dehydrogenase